MCLKKLSKHLMPIVSSPIIALSRVTYYNYSAARIRSSSTIDHEGYEMCAEAKSIPVAREEEKKDSRENRAVRRAIAD